MVNFQKEKKTKLTCDACENWKSLFGWECWWLTQIVYKFINEKKNFDMILGKQNEMPDKSCIGYNFLK